MSNYVTIPYHFFRELLNYRDDAIRLEGRLSATETPADNDEAPPSGPPEMYDPTVPLGMRPINFPPPPPSA